MPNFTEPDKVLQTIRNSDDAERSRGENRVLINRAANNEPLLDEEEATRIGMQIFNRWGEMMGTLAHARRQFLTNFTSQPNYFTIDIPKCPEEKRADWSGYITERINDKLKNGEKALGFFELHRSRWASVACHGIAPMIWDDPFDWLPRCVGIEDFRVPTDTELSFRNLTWFAVRIAYTPGELSRKAFSPEPGKYKWNKKAVADLLKSVEEVNSVMAENNYDWNTVPEKFDELRKQNAGYWTGDAMPSINLWHFFHREDSGGWSLKMVPEVGATTSSNSEASDQFVCESTQPLAKSWQELVHVQYGDLNNKAPFMFHSVRSLGFALYEPCYWTDFVRCRMIQHVLDQFNILLRITDPIDRARASIQVFQNLGVLKPGVQIVPASERHQVDGNLVEAVMAQTKQLQQEASTAYTQNIDTGTQKEQTAFETGVKVQQTNAMLSGIMVTASTYEKFAYREICRRFCLEKSDDPDVVEFRKECQEYGIDLGFLDVKKWVVEPMLPLGMGNPTMAMVEADNALKLRPMLDPSSQSEALYDAAVQMVGAKRASRWIKTKANKVSESANAAANAFPLMMLGLPPQIPEGLNPIEQIQTLMGLIVGYMMKIEQTTKTPTMQELTGLQTVATYIEKLVQGMAGDTANQAIYKKFAHDLSQVFNEIKKLQQHFNMAMQKQAQQQGGAAEAMQRQAEVQAKMAETAAEIKRKQVESAHDMQLQDAKFVSDKQRKDFEAVHKASLAKKKSKSKSE
jgi:hypothetical protein